MIKIQCYLFDSTLDLTRDDNNSSMKCGPIIEALHALKLGGIDHRDLQIASQPSPT